LKLKLYQLLLSFFSEHRSAVHLLVCETALTSALSNDEQ